MGDRGRIALVSCAALWAGYAFAQPAPGAGSGSGSASGSASGDIEMEPDTTPAGSGSAAGSGSGSAAAGSAATGSAATGSAAGSGSDVAVKDPKVARKWLAAAQTLVQKGDYWTRAQKIADAKAQYENAVTAYQKAIEASDDISIYYSLALVEDKLGLDADAFHHLKLVVDPKASQKPDVVKKAQAKLDEIAMKVGTLTLTLKPEGTTITLNGKSLGESPLPEPLIFDPGTYTLSFAAVGYQPKDAEFKIEPGSESERKIELEPVPMVVKKQEEPEPVTAPPAGLDPKLPLFIGAGATGGLVLIATITGVVAVGKHGTYTDPMTSPDDRRDAQSSGKTFAHITDICLVGAIGAAAFTTYWYLYKYKPAEEAQEAKVSVAPWVQPTSGGLTVLGAF